jgi:hypothetical protein
MDDRVENSRRRTDNGFIMRGPTVFIVSVLTGVLLELSIQAVSGQHEAWDSGLYFAIGIPAAMFVSAMLGFRSRGRQWIWTLVIIPSQVTTMMLRSGEIGAFWPLMVALSALLSAPFVSAAAIGAAWRSTTPGGQARAGAAVPQRKPPDA